MRTRRTLTLGLAGVFLVGCAGGTITPAAVFPPPPVHEPADPPADRRLLPFLGDWDVRATIFPHPGADDGERRQLTGTARFVAFNDGRSLRERLTLDGFRAATILGFSPERGRYELSQVDNATGGQIWMVGLCSADGRTLELEPAEPGQLEGLGFGAMRWTYGFDANGQLVKTIRVRESDGLWRTQSSYVYSRSRG